MVDSSWDRGGQAHRVIEDLVRDFGPQVLSNAQLLRNLLGDKLPAAPKETSLLVAAAEAGVAPLLRDLLGQELPPETAVREAAIALEERRGYDPTACTWVVTEFARAMGHEVDESETIPGPAGAAAGATQRVQGNGAGGRTREIVVEPRPPTEHVEPVAPRERKFGDRTSLIVLLVAAVAVVAAVAFALTRGSGSNNNNASNSTVPPTTSLPSTTQNVELIQGQAVQNIVAESAQVRPGVGNAVNAISSCGDIQGAVATLQNAAQTRHTLLTQASGLTVTAIPNGAAVRQNLVRALDNSATADQDYAAWGRDVLAGGFCQGTAPLDGNYSAATNSDQNATNAKQQFASVWNPTAQALGLPPADPDQF